MIGQKIAKRQDFVPRKSAPCEESAAHLPAGQHAEKPLLPAGCQGPPAQPLDPAVPPGLFWSLREDGQPGRCALELEKAPPNQGMGEKTGKHMDVGGGVVASQPGPGLGIADIDRLNALKPALRPALLPSAGGQPVFIAQNHLPSETGGNGLQKCLLMGAGDGLPEHDAAGWGNCAHIRPEMWLPIG